MPLSEQQRQQFDDLVKKTKVVLFMKGNQHFPQCGFSAQVVGILKETGVPFETVNVLADPVLRDGIKEYSDWPTIPQLYVDGEFVGGCDIVKDMYAAGDLQKKLGLSDPAPIAPRRSRSTSAQSKRSRTPTRVTVSTSASRSAKPSSTTSTLDRSRPATSRSSRAASRCCSTGRARSAPRASASSGSTRPMAARSRSTIRMSPRASRR